MTHEARLGAVKAVSTILIVAVTAFALSACSGPGEAPATPEHGAEPPDGTPTPTLTATPSGLSVNYERFAAGWDDTDASSKRVACGEFFASNGIEDQDVQLSPQMTGADAENWFNQRMEMVYDLYRDRSNPDNKDVARKIVDCLTVKREPTDQARSFLEGQFHGIDSFSDYVPLFVRPESITAYSDGVFSATDYLGNQYGVFAVQGRTNGVTGGEQYQAFDYVGVIDPWLLLTLSLDAAQLESDHFGDKPPIVG